MGDLLKTGAAWLAGQFATHCSQDVTYSRGVQSVVLAANLGRTEFEVADDEGIVREFQSHDFIVSPADLDLGAGEVTPARGDRITAVVRTTTKVYEVMSPGDEPPWRWTDAHCNRRRIHTKLVSET